jgi:hypothetical protein
MSFYDVFHKYFLHEVLVKNASPSPSYSGSLIADWEKYKGKTAKFCARCGQRLAPNDKVGGHVLKDPGLTFDYYVVPLCKDCNHSSITDPYYVSRFDLVRLLDLKHNK